MSFIFIRLSLDPMSHVDLKKWPCRRVEFKGQDPLWSKAGMGNDGMWASNRNIFIMYYDSYMKY